MKVDIWMLLAGTGIFLFGIYLMEEALKALSGKAFKSFIRKYTSSPFKAVLTGTFSTAILQSSSAVSLMVLAFVGAGIMTLSNAFGVILGANIGSTLTSWIVATVGFKASIESFSLPLIGIGGLGLIVFGRTTRISNISKLIVGFGFLFLGLDYMKTSMEGIMAGVDLRKFNDYSILFFVLAGFILTAVMQASSASMALILTALYGNMIDFYPASAMVIGINIGTTVTVLIGSIGGSIAKKQVALVHILFNTSMGIVALIFLHPMNYLVLDLFNLKNDPLVALALFHTLFNVAGVLLFFPFISLMAGWVTKLIKDKKIHHSYFIHKATTDVPEAAIRAINNEAIILTRFVMAYNLHLFQLETKLILSASNILPVSDPEGSPDKLYAKIKSIQGETYLFASRLQGQQLSEPEAIQLNAILHAVRYAIASAKTLKDIAHELDNLEQSDHPAMTRRHQEYRKKMMHFYILLDALLHGESHPDNLSQLTALIREIKEEDHRAIKSLSASIQTEGITEEEVSSILATNRSFYLSLRQLTLAIKDLILTPEEAEKVEGN